MAAGRILTTHVGSLVRPPALVALARPRQDGQPVDERAYEDCLRREITDVVRRQAEIGLDFINDGELGKSISWSRYILQQLAGFERRPAESGMPKGVHGKDRRDFAEFYREYDATTDTSGMRGWVVTGPISYKGQATIQRTIDMLKDALKGAKVAGAFIPAVSPTSVAPDREDEYYPSSEESLIAIADALREEYRAIVDAGFLLQVDDSYFASTYDMMVPPGTLRDYRKWAARQVEVINYALKGIPEDRVRFHICWGSWNGPHSNDAAFKDIADIVLKIRASAYSIEMANPRHEHEWRVWETVKLPAGKVLLPGTVSHATNIVEHPELVAERITRLAKLVGRDNVIASTDCGFAAQAFVARVHPSIQWAKLGAVVAGARIASKELWRKTPPRRTPAGTRKQATPKARKAARR
jgi:5-methyltetrahydropteroyltriglutamate--homocysteine methyltransferase